MALPKGLQDIVDKKQDYIDKNRNRLESDVIKMQEAFLQRFIEEILPEFETKDGLILNTTKNIKLIERLDQIYNDFSNTNQAKVVQSLGQSLIGMNKLNQDYFNQITLNEVTKKRFDSVASNTDKLLSARIGVNENGEIIKGSYLDSFITDNSLLTDLKQTVVKHITGGQPITEFRKVIKDKIIGNKDVTGGFEKYYRTFAYDTYQQYDRAYGNQMASEFKLDYALYQGGLINDSRDFCRDHENHVYTRDEIKEFGKWTYEKAKNIDTFNDPGSQSGIPSYIKSNKNYDPFTDCGSYNCRHQLSWITKQAAERLRPDLKVIKKEDAPKPATISKNPEAKIDYQKELSDLRADYQKALDNNDIDKMGKIGARLSEINKIIQGQSIVGYIQPKTNLKIVKPKISKGLTIDEAKEETPKAKFSETEKEAVTTYTKGNYTQINSYLRGQRKNISDENSKVVSELDSFIKKAPKVEAETYRGMSFSEKEDFYNFINLKKGSTYTDKGFLSTTYDKKIAETFTNMDAYRVMVTIKGKSGVYIEYLSDAKKEKEILFGRESTFKISSIKTVKKGNGFATVEMELIEI